MIETISINIYKQITITSEIFISLTSLNYLLQK